MSLSLTLYLANARRHGARILRNSLQAVDYAKRPNGELVWIHLGSAKDLHKVQALMQKLTEERGEIAFVVTSDNDTVATYNSDRTFGRVYYSAMPHDSPQLAHQFLAHWKPDVIIWLTEKLRPALIIEANTFDIPVLMMGIEAPAEFKANKRGNSSIIKDILRRFQAIVVVNDTVKTQLLRQGADAQTIQTSGHLGFDVIIPPCTDSERDECAALLSTRPVWMAQQVIPSELETVITAHRSASRLAHRLLLVVMPNDPQLGVSYARELYDLGWHVGLRSKGDLPMEDTQILIADIPSELGLWLRISPICFHGNTVSDVAYGTAPFDALSLGSSIIHGPKTGEFAVVFDRIDAVGAARLVENETELSAVVAELLAPDKAAAMAHAGWELSSQSGQATDQMVLLLHDVLDKVG